MICAICGLYINNRGSSSHLSHKHNLSPKEYYDKYFKKENEEICNLPGCDNITSFIGISKGYKNHCCASHANLDPETQAKIRKTCLEKYDVESSNQSELVKLKMKTTFLRKYGVDNCQKCKEIAIKTVETRQKNNLEMYGVTELSKLQEVRDKISKSTREYMLNRTEEESKEFYSKIREIKRKNGTLKTSKPEENFYHWLLTIFNDSDVFRNYSDDIRYPFMCDFYIKSQDMFIELNLFWMHGFHWFDKNNAEDIFKLNTWKEKAKQGHKQYKAAVKVWSYSDLIKKDAAEQHKLNYIVLWNDKDIIEFKQQIEGNLKNEKI